MARFLSYSFLAFGALLILGLGFIAWAKVPAPTPENLYTQTGTLASISSPCCGDVVITLEGDAHSYYVNQDLVPLFDWEKMAEEIAVGTEVELTVIKTRWNPLNYDRQLQPLAAVKAAGQEYLPLAEVSQYRIR
ncbi:MAG: hypothetical protein AAFR61_24685 [Bacteroidota bacterium]